MEEHKTFLGKYSKGTQRRIKVLLFCTAIILGISVFYLSIGIGNIVSSNKLLEDKKIELAQEEQRRAILLEDIEKIDDPDYIRQYAREYHYTEPGEILFILPPETVSAEETENQKETSTNVA